jgi:Asp-tRNA(Asn)/Glu-tRNA(Gln) amidotransferase A subunit family amidase
MAEPQLPGTAHEALAALRASELSASELTDAAIARIERSTLGTVELLDADGAREQARAADAAIARGDAGPLVGLPILVKDVIDVAGLPTRGGAARWRREPTCDADCVAALRAAGAVVLGKAHTNELAFGIDGRNPHRPPCVNPHDASRLPGGSSSGPAVALAAGLALGALGTDTSGSIRVPAALCGVAGLRPSHGLLSRRGALPLAPSYDVVGPLAPCVADLRLLFDALVAGACADAAPPVSPRKLAPGERRPPASALTRVAIVEDLLDPSLCEPTVAAAVRDAASALERAGVEIVSVTISELEHALVVHRDVQVPEAAASLHALGVPEDELGREVRERVRSAWQITPARHAEALRDRARIAAALDRAIPPAGALLAPAAPIPAPPREANEWRFRSGGVRSIRETLLSCTVPLTQPPGPVVVLPLSIPDDSLPIGAQLLARAGQDRELLDLANGLERELSVLRIDSQSA